MKNIHLLFIIIVTGFTSCKPNNEAGDYTILAQAPSASPMAVQAQENQPKLISYQINKNSSSVSAVVKIISQPKHGSLSNCSQPTLDQFNCTYTAYSGTTASVDSFQVQAIDGDLIGEVATITINITQVNDAPVLGANQSHPLVENSFIDFSVFIATDEDHAAHELQYEIFNQPSHGTLSSCFTTSGNRNCRYSTNNYHGQDSFTYRVKDKDGLYASGFRRVTFNISEEQAIILSNTQRFIQNQNTTQIDGADIVFVVDNSGSMGGEQADLQQNFNSFIDNFIVNGVAQFPFNIAVTTTDAYRESGDVFQKNSSNQIYDLSHQKAQSNFTAFKNDFISAVGVGTQGNGSERGMESFQKAYNQHTNWFSGNNRALVVIFISDEPDQSTSQTAQQWVSWAQTLKDNPAKVKVYSIARRFNNDRYFDYTTLSGGSFQDVTSNFDSILSTISTQISNLISSFLLDSSLQIIPSSIVVKVNNIVIPQAGNWSYTSGGIIFTNPPAANAVIDVTYNYEI